MKNKINKGEKKHMKSKHIAIITLFMTVLLLFSLSTISAANNTIGAGDTGGIKQGIDDTGDKDTLFLQPGTYNKTNEDTNITINKNITIQGNGSTDSVIIDAQGLSRMFTVASNLTVTFINITFINGNSGSTAAAGDGGAIRATYVNSISIIGCTFINNTGATGGAVYLNGRNYNNIQYNNDSMIIIDNCTFINNQGSAQAGGLKVISSSLSMKNSIFINNTANSTVGGASVHADANFNQSQHISNCIFIGNIATDYYAGGLDICDSPNSTVSNCTFQDNSAPMGGALMARMITTISGCTFINNTANQGGAIYTREANYLHCVSILNSTFISNVANISGGAIYNNPQNNVFLSGNIMSLNTAGLGQMIYNNGTMGILNLTFINNSTVIVKNGSTITLYATLTDGMGNTVTGQNISFYLNGVLYENIESIEGKASINYTVPSTSGDIPVSGVYAGNGAYDILISNGLLQVRIPTKITISVPKEVKVGDTVTLESKLTDEDSNPLAGKTVDFYVDGVKIGSGTTDSNGIAKLNYTFTKAGKTNVVAKFAGDNNYLASNATNQTTASKIPTTIAVETDKDTISVTLNDEDGNPIANKTVAITINGKTYTKTTNSKGQVIIKYKNAWNYKVTANFAEDNQYFGSKASEPKRTKTKITIKKEGDKITVTLTDENGNPLAGKKLTFRIKGVVIGLGITDENGQVVIYYKNADKSAVTVSFDGGEQYAPSNATSTPTSDAQASGKVAMKETGIPIIAILVALISIIGLLSYRKKKQ